MGPDPAKSIEALSQAARELGAATTEAAEDVVAAFRGVICSFPYGPEYIPDCTPYYTGPRGRRTPAVYSWLNTEGPVLEIGSALAGHPGAPKIYRSFRPRAPPRSAF